MKYIVCQFPSIQFQEEIFEELTERSNQPKHSETSNNVIIQIPTVNDLKTNSCHTTPRSNNLYNTPRNFEFYGQRFNTPCSENISVKQPTVPIGKILQTEQKQQQRENLFPHRSVAEIGIALRLWRKIDKMHQQIDHVKQSHEKQNRVRLMRLYHTQKRWENFVKRGKRIALLQKQRSIEKMQFDKQKLEQIKAQNELNEKLKTNRERLRFLENYHKHLKNNEQLFENYANSEKRLSDQKLFIQEKCQQLMNLQNRTSKIRSRLNEAIEAKKLHQNELSAEIHRNRLCEKFSIESKIQERKLKESNSISEHVKQLRQQKLVKIPISMKLTNLTLDDADADQ
ncbi:unnamed protein product [Schistosoma turkestanicum]|nr:unnamed protein product [Schistosoma turkestanicum]